MPRRMKTLTEELSFWERRDIILPKKPLKFLPKAHFGTFDIETETIGTGPNGVGAFLLAASYSPETGLQFHTTLAELVDLFIDSPVHHWYAHNGMAFDYEYLLADDDARERIFTRGYAVQVLSSKTQAVGLSLEEADPPTGVPPHRVGLRDFFRIMPKSLKAITQEFGVAHAKRADIDFAAGEQFDPANPTHRDYLEWDVRGLYESVDAFRRHWWEAFKDDLGWTLPGMAYSAWRRTLTKSFYRHAPGLRAFFRDTYRGGMVIPHYAEITPQVQPLRLLRALKDGPGWDTVRTAPEIASFDVNSMYPTQMLQGVPVGQPMEVQGYVSGLPGFYDVTMTAPETGFTPIAIKSPTGLIYPRGQFRAQITSIEWDQAVRMGYTIDTVHKGYVFPGVEKIFAKFLKQCQRIRRDHKGTPLETVAKLAQNSLYGKFGSAEDHTDVVLTRHPSPDHVPHLSPTLSPTGEMTWVPDMYEMPPQPLDVPYLHPEWASWITASARMMLTEAILRVGYDRFVYADTDSIKVVTNGWTPADFQKIGTIDDTQYGAWKHEYTLTEWYCAGAKTYAGRFADPGHETVRTKGVPRRGVTAAMVADAVHGEAVPIGFIQGRSLLTMIHASYAMRFMDTARELTIPTRVLNWVYDADDRAWDPKRLGEEGSPHGANAAVAQH